MNDGNEILRVEGLSKTFKLSKKQQRIERTSQTTRVAVNDLSFCAYPGEIFGLLGPNGAGKTTTLRILATLIKPDCGDAFIEGTSVIRDPEYTRSRIGFLTSDLRMEDFFTPDYLFDFFSTLRKIDPAVAAGRKELLFCRFGINEFAQVKIKNLSSGMKQKASLVLSIVHDPDIIIFDEPTNGLDVITAKLVTDYLEELRAAGKSIVLSTHIFSLVERLCDRVGIIFEGQMVACDTLENICEGSSLEDRFFELYRQAGGEVA
ncbi:MAG: ABC transporter ATP-binding protein [Coriobacteriales bacterium]|jgi:sodium transport system ATP-binding protein|nr:ABC transporter ATP-binding protein [Coriobacteriales bacterium]